MWMSYKFFKTYNLPNAKFLLWAPKRRQCKIPSLSFNILLFLLESESPWNDSKDIGVEAAKLGVTFQIDVKFKTEEK